VPCGNDDEEDIALPAPSTRKPEVAVKQDATPVIPEHVPADGDTFDNENGNGQSSRAKLARLPLPEHRLDAGIPQNISASPFPL
jgi:hypothetical protein